MNATLPILRSTVLAALLLASAAPVSAAALPVNQLLIDAGITVSKLQVTEAEGIVIIRGRVSDRHSIERAKSVLIANGYPRVANLLQLATHTHDADLQRAVERALATSRSLEGCRFNVRTEGGVVRLTGSIQHELQKEVASALVRNVDGVRQVVNELRFGS